MGAIQGAADSLKDASAAAGGEDGLSREQERNSRIIRTSVIGIAANVLLALFKAAVGLAANSIAIVMDAVNNLSDAASSVITIVGTKLAAKEADKKHPFGYGRIEYLSAMVISLLVLYAGVTALTESVKKILHPDVPEYSAVTLAVVAVAVAVKIVLGRYTVSVGRSVNSDSLINSGEDAKLDSVISASTLAAAVIFMYWHISLEAWLGAVIAGVIVKAGLEMLGGTLSQVLGERVDVELVRKIKQTLLSYPEIHGAYDLILHDYGPDLFNGSVHVEVPAELTADQIDRLSRKLIVDVYKTHGVLLTAVGIYSINTQDKAAAEAREKISAIVRANPQVLQMHGFYFDAAEKNLRFDLVIDFKAPDRRQVFRDVCAAVRQLYPDYTLQAAVDMDFSESC